MHAACMHGPPVVSPTTKHVVVACIYGSTPLIFLAEQRRKAVSDNAADARWWPVRTASSNLRACLHACKCDGTSGGHAS